MTTLTRWAVRLGLAGLATGGVIAACRHQVPAPIVDPRRREAPPMGPRPEPVEPTLWPRILKPVPAALPVRQDAAVDGALLLPRNPDAGGMLRDAGQPMTR